MTLHRELFNDLPPAENLLAMYAEAFKTAKDADGYYIIVQYIAEKYGETAYDLAEEVFKECGMQYDPQLLRTPDAVSRVGYNLDGMNVNNIQMQPFVPEMAHDLVLLYNREIRKLSREALLTEEGMRALASEGLLVACNESGQPVGFVHCWVDEYGAAGSIEALIFSEGRIYEPVARNLVSAAKAYFADRKITKIDIFGGHVAYPFQQVVKGDWTAAFSRHLEHIYRKLVEIA